MKNLSLNQMENVEGGLTPGQQGLAGLSCGLAMIWPIGTLIAGPTCAGLLIRWGQE